tara:strand:+ start:911 stop:2557 length:1647 start_codon:yes stop_codon:yes gene_type:complete
MLISASINVYLITVLIGFSVVLKNFLHQKEVEIYNLDILYGLFFLIFSSLFLNFFFPLKYFLLLTIIIGTFFFIRGLIRKQIKINLIYHFLIIFLFTFIIYKNGFNVDTPMYHLQLIKWLNNEKIVFGLSNLEIRFGSNSLWFSIISLFQFKYKNFNSIYTFNLIPFSILIYQLVNIKQKISYIFLALGISYILLFSLLHPYLNGVILNHLNNTEVDTVGMVFFILTFFLFLKYFENENIENLRLLILCSVICMTVKLSFFAVIVLPLYALFKFYKNNFKSLFKDKLNLLMILFVFFWTIKNLITSGCLIFLANFTCFNFPWSPGLEEIENYSKIVKGFARDTRDRLRYSDFQHTIYSFNWFIPWFKDYALNNAFLKIFSLISLLSLFLIKLFSSLNLFDKSFLRNKYYYLLFSVLILPNFYLWFNAPETRFGWGPMITLSCFLLSVVIFHFKYLKNLLFINAKFLTFTFLILLAFKNSSNYSFKNLIYQNIRPIDYSNIVKINNFNGFNVYKSNNSKCYDFEEICVNKPKDKYKIFKKYQYFIFLKN